MGDPSISIDSEQRRSTFNKLEMPAYRIGFADLIEHLLVILLHTDPKIVGTVRAGNVRCIDIVDEGRDQQDSRLSGERGYVRRAGNCNLRFEVTPTELIQFGGYR